MPVLRRRAQSNGRAINGLFIHSSPPRVLQLSSAHVKQLIRSGDIDKLEQAVLEGQGKKLVGEYSADYKTRTFLKSIPALMSKISLLHDAVNSGRLEELQSLLEEEPDKKKKLVLAKDDSGVGLLHKAVYYDLNDIYKWLIDKFPHIVSLRDAEGRTAYHYTPMCRDPQNVQKLLTNAGADPSSLDVHQHSAKYYMDHKQELELPSGEKTTPKIRKRTTNTDSLNFKKSNIRIWIHQRNLTNLQQVVWEGHGSKLLVEHSNNPKIKKFLEAVPHIMGLIKEIHTDVQNGDLDSLKSHVSPPIPPMVLSGKDANGLTALHKAVGLGKDDIVEYIVNEYPNCINATDNDGRTALHYAALLKDDGKMTNFLIEHGADESALDGKQKTAAYYKTRNSELDAKLLNVVPECPRSAKESFAANFDWSMLTSSIPLNGVKETIHKVERIIENTSENNDEKDKEVKENGKDEKEEEQNEENNNDGKEDPKINAEENEVEKEEEKVEEKEEEKQDQETEKGQDEEENVGEKEEEKVVKMEIEEDKNENELPEENNKDVPDNKEEQTNQKNVNEVSSDGEEVVEEPAKKDEQELNEQVPSTKEEENNNVEVESNEKYTQNNDDVEEHSQHYEEDRKSKNSQEPAEHDDKSDNEKVEEPEPLKSRPSSVINSQTRPSSQVGRSRPSSRAQENSRPSSKINSNTRPNSRAVENGQNQYERHKTPEPVVDGEGIIEGVVNGEDEVETLNNEGQNQRNDSSPESEEDVKALVEAGNMEQLASLVLNGDGEKLVGQTSDNPELQSFLDNVPVYMSKINRIHEAARNGSLRDLQAALDRRKFAIAKDSISPNGASPLHVAVIFGNTSIVRYLAGRFPETVQVIDENGRTPLHYAAVMSDNGHYYNLLVHLGADTRTQDKFGHASEYYRKNQSQTEFSHRSLLKEFGAEEQIADEILSDKVPADTFSARKDLDDEDMLAVLDRCYNVLHGRRNSNVSTSSASTTVSNAGSTTILAKHIKRNVFENVKHRLTKLDHNLYDVIWPSVKKLPADLSFRVALEQDFPLGIVAPDFYVYKVFKEFLEPIIKDYNAIDLHHKLPLHPESKFLENISEDNHAIDVEMDLDPHMKWIITGTLDTTRNLVDFELPKSLNHGELEVVERIITTVLLSDDVAKALYPLTSYEEIEEKGSGTYYTMNEVLEEPSEARILLASNGLLIPLWNIPDSDRLHGRFWPYGRGVFVSNNANLAVWINVLDHIRVVTCTSHARPGNVGQIYSRIARLMAVLDQQLKFHFDKKLGYLTARPSALGNTLQFNLTVRFPYLIKEPNNLRHLCAVRGLTYNRSTSTTDVVRIGNQQCLGITELQCFEDFCTAVANILQLEKDLAMSNSLHIAAMFLNMFRKKKLEDNANLDNGQVDMPFFATEEGRYLASSLGDPLIKGLTEVANKRPEDPIAYLAQYLYNFANTRNSVRSRGRTQETQQVVTGSPAPVNDNNAVPANIDVVTVEPEDNNSDEESAFSNTSRDEHGQSMLHFAAARAHGRNALFQLLLETEINVAYRDELYRTARDITIQANIPENTEEIDRYVLHIATKGDTDKLVELLLDGYDHITDIIDDEDVPIIEAVSKANQSDTVSFLQSILAFEEKRERVHHAIRQGSINDVTALLADENDTGSGKLLAIGKNNYGRCTLHIAVLCQQEEIVDYLANTFPETLKLGDNLERTALHYAMGVEKMEMISRVLIKAGAKRVTKDLKGRQPTYYFLNKSEILRLQEEEETF